MENKKLFTLPLINKWYVVLTLIFIIMRVTNIIDWSPFWILCPLWLPICIAIILVLFINFLQFLIYIFK